jgi:outer membrane lipoprotein-sorting protein
MASLLYRLIAAATLASIVPPALSAAEPGVKQLLEAADRIRTPPRPFRTTATLTEFQNGKAKSQLVLNVFVKLDPSNGQYRNLIRYAQPARDAGKMLLVSGRALWFYDPASKSSVRISPQQRLLGQASVADVLSANFAREYNGRAVGEVRIADGDKKARTCIQLDLRAATPQASYRRIDYWIEKGTGQPIKAKFYTDSGALLKTLYYRGFRTVAGQVRPGEAVVLDGVRPSLVTTVKFGIPQFVDIPEAWFQRDYLPRLSAG